MRRLPEYLLVLFALVGTLSIAASQVAMAAGCAVILVDRGRRTALQPPHTGLIWPVLGWAAASLLATSFSSDRLASTVNLKKLALLGMLFWPPAVVTRKWSVARLVMAMLFGAGITSLYGVFTFFLQGGPELDVRIRGFHGFYLTNAEMLLLCSFPALLAATQRQLAASYRLGAAICAGSILLVLFFGRIHAVWLGSVAGLLYLMIARRRRMAAILLAAFGLSFFVAPAVVKEAGRDLLSLSSDANQTRLRMWAHGVELFRERPWTGWGLHDLQQVYARVMSPGEIPQGHLHSVPLTVAAQMGIPGLVALAWLAVALFLALRRARAGLPAGFERDMVDGAEAGLIAFLAAGIIEWNLGDSEILTLLCFWIGLAIAASRVARQAAAAAA